MRVALLLLATRAASAWSPSFRSSSSPWEIPSTKTEPNRCDFDDTSHENFATSAWDGMLPKTLGDGSDDVYTTSGTTLLHDSPKTSSRQSSSFLKLPKPSTGRSRRQRDALPDLNDHRRSSDRIDLSYSTTQQQGIILSRTDAGTLQIEFPATGWNAHTAITGGFAIAWFAALVPATTTLAVVPILLPFYLAGGVLAKSVLVEPFTSTALSIGMYGWSLSQSRYRKNAVEVASGATQDLHRAIVVERRSHIATNTHDREEEHGCDVTRVQYRYELQLESVLNGNKITAVTIGKSFGNIDEPTQLADLINEQLEKVRSEWNFDGPAESNTERMFSPW